MRIHQVVGNPEAVRLAGSTHSGSHSRDRVGQIGATAGMASESDEETEAVASGASSQVSSRQLGAGPKATLQGSVRGLLAQDVPEAMYQRANEAQGVLKNQVAELVEKANARIERLETALSGHLMTAPSRVTGSSRSSPPTREVTMQEDTFAIVDVSTGIAKGGKGRRRSGRRSTRRGKPGGSSKGGKGSGPDLDAKKVTNLKKQGDNSEGRRIDSFLANLDSKGGSSGKAPHDD